MRRGRLGRDGLGASSARTARRGGSFSTRRAVSVRSSSPHSGPTRTAALRKSFSSFGGVERPLEDRRVPDLAPQQRPRRDQDPVGQAVRAPGEVDDPAAVLLGRRQRVADGLGVVGDVVPLGPEVADVEDAVAGQAVGCLISTASGPPHAAGPPLPGWANSSYSPGRQVRRAVGPSSENGSALMTGTSTAAPPALGRRASRGCGAASPRSGEVLADDLHLGPRRGLVGGQAGPQRGRLEEPEFRPVQHADLARRLAGADLDAVHARFEVGRAGRT